MSLRPSSVAVPIPAKILGSGRIGSPLKTSTLAGHRASRARRASASVPSIMAAIALNGAAALTLACAGCGHPATRVECDEIINRSAEIELRMQNVTDPKIIAERTAAMRTVKGEDLLRRCVGKRITSGAMECVRKATTTEQMDGCLD